MSYVEPGEPGELVRELRAEFRRTFEKESDVVGRAPGRVNLIGEHTDYNAGLVLPLALPHATYAAVARRDDDRVRIASRQETTPWEGTLSGLGPGQVEGWVTYAAGVLWALGEAGHQLPGMDVLVDGRVPLGSGLSSSAALECSVAVAVTELIGLTLSPEVRHGLVEACVRAETEVAGAPTGGMDQTVSLLAEAGTALLIDFDTDVSTPVDLGLEAAGLTLLVTDTRVSHALVDGGYAARRADCEAAAQALGVPSLRHADLDAVEGLQDDQVRRRARHIVTEIARVSETVEALSRDDWVTVGRLFAASHASMRDDFEISCRELDLVVSTAVEAGAIASRMTGGGFGGSAVSLVPDERVGAVVRAIDTAFVAAGYQAPQYLLVEPSAGAGLVVADA